MSAWFFGRAIAKEHTTASICCRCALRSDCRQNVGLHSLPRRGLSSTSTARATTLPITGAGPPPSAPSPKSTSSGSAADRVATHRRKAALLETAKEIRASQSPNPSRSPLKKRFWQSVHVKTTPEGYQIFLDKRPVRTPTKEIITIPLSKPNLAHAIAIEWDMLNSAQEALKNHKIPMTSIVSRAVDIQAADSAGGVGNDVRQSIVQTMLRYLDTDTLLCWAPERSSVEMAYATRAPVVEEGAPKKKSLRDLQTATARPIIAYLTSTIWPGVSITPTLDPDSIIPQKQSEVTRSVIEGWVAGLPAYELAALERAVLATKSLLVAARLVVEWSEEFKGLQQAMDDEASAGITARETISASIGGKASVESSTDPTEAANAAGLAEGESRFGIESAARAATLEVSWQTGMWGEVEDTHDVEKEDVRRQLGSAVLVVAGRGR